MSVASMSGSQRSSSSTSRLMSESSLISHTPGLLLPIVELWQGFQLLLGRARQHDPRAVVVDLQRCVGHRDQAAANAEEPTDLNDGEQHTILAHNQIVESAN